MDYPRKDADGKTGSNLDGETSRLLFEAELRKDVALHDKLARDYLKQYSKLLTKKDLRLVAKITSDVADQWRHRVALPELGHGDLLAAHPGLVVAAEHQLDAGL